MADDIDYTYFEVGYSIDPALVGDPKTFIPNRRVTDLPVYSSVKDVQFIGCLNNEVAVRIPSTILTSSSGGSGAGGSISFYPPLSPTSEGTDGDTVYTQDYIYTYVDGKWGQTPRDTTWNVNYLRIDPAAPSLTKEQREKALDNLGITEASASISGLVYLASDPSVTYAGNAYAVTPEYVQAALSNTIDLAKLTAHAKTTASSATLGHVKVSGSGITVTTDGTLSVKTGSGITIKDNAISANVSSTTVPTTGSASVGQVAVDSSGKLVATAATSSQAGTVLLATDTNDKRSGVVPTLAQVKTISSAAGPSVVVDQSYDQNSANAQSGTAVREAIDRLRYNTVEFDLSEYFITGKNLFQAVDTMTWSVERPTDPAAYSSNNLLARLSDIVQYVWNRTATAYAPGDNKNLITSSIAEDIIRATTKHTYSPTSEDPISGKGVATAISGIRPGTVDQAYDPTSENAQSGTAVAEAISQHATIKGGGGIPGHISGAGNGISISNGSVSLKLRTNHSGFAYDSGGLYIQTTTDTHPTAGDAGTGLIATNTQGKLVAPAASTTQAGAVLLANSTSDTRANAVPRVSDLSDHITNNHVHVDESIAGEVTTLCKTKPTSTFEEVSVGFRIPLDLIEYSEIYKVAVHVRVPLGRSRYLGAYSYSNGSMTRIAISTQAVNIPAGADGWYTYDFDTNIRPESGEYLQLVFAVNESDLGETSFVFNSNAGCRYYILKSGTCQRLTNGNVWAPDPRTPDFKLIKTVPHADNASIHVTEEDRAAWSVDQAYDPASANAQSGIAIAGVIQSIISGGGSIIVDQSYSAASTNAQSGKAVDMALREHCLPSAYWYANSLYEAVSSYAVSVSNSLNNKANQSDLTPLATKDLNNITYTGKETAVGWSMPDYTKASIWEATVYFEALYDALVIVTYNASRDPSATGSCEIKIDNVNVATLSDGTSEDYGSHGKTITLPMRQHSRITWTGPATLSFTQIPFKYNY